MQGLGGSGRLTKRGQSPACAQDPGRGAVTVNSRREDRVPERQGAGVQRDAPGERPRSRRKRCRPRPGGRGGPPGRGAGGSGRSRARGGARAVPPGSRARAGRSIAGDRPPRAGRRRRAAARTTPEASAEPASQSSQTPDSAAPAAPGPASTTAQYSLTVSRAANCAGEPPRRLGRLGPDDDPRDRPVEPVDRPEVDRRRPAPGAAARPLPGSARPRAVPWVNSPAGLSTARTCASSYRTASGSVIGGRSGRRRRPVRTGFVRRGAAPSPAAGPLGPVPDCGMPVDGFDAPPGGEQPGRARAAVAGRRRRRPEVRARRRRSRRCRRAVARRAARASGCRTGRCPPGAAPRRR